MSDFIRGIDVSHWCGVINWDLVKTDPLPVRFAFIKATDGLKIGGQYFVDSKFAYNWEQSKLVDIPRGAYHFFRPNNDPVEQAEHMANILGDDLGNLDPVLDAEVTEGVTGQELANRLYDFLITLENLTGRAPYIYTAPYWWNTNVYPYAPWADNYKLWIAHWGVINPMLPWGFTEHVFHQYSAIGVIEGINAAVDMNKTPLSEEEFAELIGGTVPPPPEYEIVECKVLKVVATALNIREGPGTKYKKVGYLTQGQTTPELKRIEKANEVWCRVGVKQWCAKEYYGNIYMVYQLKG